MNFTKPFASNFDAISFAFVSYFRSFVFMVQNPKIMLTSLVTAALIGIPATLIMLPIGIIGYKTGGLAIALAAVAGLIALIFVACMIVLAITKAASQALSGSYQSTTESIKNAFIALSPQFFIAISILIVLSVLAGVLIGLPIFAVYKHFGLSLLDLQTNQKSVFLLLAAGMVGMIAYLPICFYTITPLNIFSSSVTALDNGTLSDVWRFYKRTPYQVALAIGLMFANLAITLVLRPIEMSFAIIPAIMILFSVVKIFLTVIAATVAQTAIYHRLTNRPLATFQSKK